MMIIKICMIQRIFINIIKKVIINQLDNIINKLQNYNKILKIKNHLV